MRIFLDRKFQQVEVLATALGGVGVVAHEQLRPGVRVDLGGPTVWTRVLVAGVVPVVTLAGVDLLVCEADAAAPVKHIPEARSLPLDPSGLDGFSPPRLKDFVEV